MPENVNNEVAIEDTDSILDQFASSDETLEITFRKGSNEIILRNPKDDRIIKLKANVEEAIAETLEEEFEVEETAPLSPEQFEDGLRRLDKLGLKLSVDLLPNIIDKNEDSSKLVDTSEYE